jgi:hypothetical protein
MSNEKSNEYFMAFKIIHGKVNLDFFVNSHKRHYNDLFSKPFPMEILVYNDLIMSPYNLSEMNKSLMVKLCLSLNLKKKISSWYFSIFF